MQQTLAIPGACPTFQSPHPLQTLLWSRSLVTITPIYVETPSQCTGFYGALDSGSWIPGRHASHYEYHPATVTGIGSPLAHIGVERLRYAASLFQHGWQDLHQLLEAEHHHGTQSWLAGLHDAIRWFNEVAMPQDEIPTDIEALKDYWRSEGLRWKRVLMKVTRRHMFQEHTIEQVK